MTSGGKLIGWLVVCALPLGACDHLQNDDQIATLYRNGSISKQMRLHFGTFDAAGEANDYNLNNCRMTARALNANVREQWSSQGLPDVGFWCEPGTYREDGDTPSSFDAEFPTETEGAMAP